MTLKEKIQSDLVVAMKAREEDRVSTLRLLKSAIMKFEVSGAQKVEATDEDVLQLLKKEVKQRRDSIDQFQKGGRLDLAEHEGKELVVLESYMPEMLGESQVRALVEETANQLKAMGPQDMGKVMGAVMGKVKGQADGTVVRKAVEDVLKGLSS